MRWADGRGGIEKSLNAMEEPREVASAVTVSPRFVAQCSTVMDVAGIVRFGC